MVKISSIFVAFLETMNFSKGVSNLKTSCWFLIHENWEKMFLLFQKFINKNKNEPIVQDLSKRSETDTLLLLIFKGID